MSTKTYRISKANIDPAKIAANDGRIAAVGTNEHGLTIELVRITDMPTVLCLASKLEWYIGRIITSADDQGDTFLVTEVDFILPTDAVVGLDGKITIPPAKT